MKVKMCTSNEEHYLHMKKMLVLNTIRLYHGFVTINLKEEIYIKENSINTM